MLDTMLPNVNVDLVESVDETRNAEKSVDVREKEKCAGSFRIRIKRPTRNILAASLSFVKKIIFHPRT